MERNRQRVDKWLCFARVVKTRAVAAELVADGHLRVNGIRQINPARPVGPGDVLTVSLERQVRVLRVLDIAERRGPYREARLLFEDAVPAGEAAAEPASEAEACGGASLAMPDRSN